MTVAVPATVAVAVVAVVAVVVAVPVVAVVVAVIADSYRIVCEFVVFEVTAARDSPSKIVMQAAARPANKAEETKRKNSHAQPWKEKLERNPVLEMHLMHL